MIIFQNSRRRHLYEILECQGEEDPQSSLKEEITILFTKGQESQLFWTLSQQNQKQNITF